MITNRKLVGLLLIAFALAVKVPPTASQGLKDEAKASASDLERGRQVLATNCAACHGLDGKGSERAPNIADSPDMRRLSDVQLLAIIGNGIPGTGMPAFHSLEPSQMHGLIAYLRSLEGAEDRARLPGNAESGKAIFFGKAGCSQCHTIAGHGGFIASDLTEFARTHSAEEVRSAIIDPGAGKKRQIALATATLRNGDKYVGVVRNEDNFSLQLQSLDGTFRFISKSDLEKLEYDAKPLMPDFASAFSGNELNDLVKFLITASGDKSTQHSDEMDNLED